MTKYVFLQMVKPILETKTYNKVKFGYSDDQNTKKIMEDLFDLEQLESAFGGNDNTPFDINKYADRMKEDDKKIPSFWTREISPSSVPIDVVPSLDSIKLDTDSDASDNEKIVSSSDSVTDTGFVDPDQNSVIQEDRNASAGAAMH
jgi:hypothetical protein